VENSCCHKTFSSRPSNKCLIRGPGAPAKVTTRVFAGRLPVSHASRSSGEFIKPDGRNAKKEEPPWNIPRVRLCRTEPHWKAAAEKLAPKIEPNATRRLWAYLATPLSHFASHSVWSSKIDSRRSQENSIYFSVKYLYNRARFIFKKNYIHLKIYRLILINIYNLS